MMHNNCGTTLQSSQTGLYLCVRMCPPLRFGIELLNHWAIYVQA